LQACYLVLVFFLLLSANARARFVFMNDQLLKFLAGSGDASEKTTGELDFLDQTRYSAGITEIFGASFDSEPL